MDDDADHAVLTTLAIGTVFIWAASVERDHWVFHSDIVGVYRPGYRIRVINGVV